MTRTKWGKILFNIKCYYYFILGKVFGISFIVKYLRNPDPTISIYLLKVFGAKIGVGTTIKRTIYLDNVYEDENSKGDFSNLLV